MRVTVLECFDGTSDSKAHVGYYKSLMYVLNYKETTKCRLFIYTLKLHARAWFTSFISQSINSWMELRDTFIELFVENCSTEILIVSLMQLKQGDDESLRDFIERFKMGIVTIKDLKMQEAVRYFTRKLNIRANKDIVKDLITKSPQMLGEVYKTAQDYIFVEETLRHCIFT